MLLQFTWWKFERFLALGIKLLGVSQAFLLLWPILERNNLKGDRFILVYGFRDFSPWSLAVLILVPW
jgi:hypothetical protein